MAEAHELRFQEELQKLEKTIRDLEGGRLDLDEALARFEEGIALTRRLRARLDEAEGRVERLLDDGTAETLEIS